MSNSSILQCGAYSLSLTRPLVMGILNLTPDSFSDGGQFNQKEQAIERAYALKEAGADILDMGGESTRPGALPVSIEEECDRVLPVIEALQTLGLPLSLDTRRTAVMKAALKVGIHLINDVSALADEGALETVAASEVGVCLMHMKGEPQQMQSAPYYEDVVQEVESALLSRAERALSYGIARKRLILDPGFGFGKNLDHNIALFKALPRLAQQGFPLLVGVSRKRMIGELTGFPIEQRMTSSVVAAVLAVQKQASIVRVHDVAETRAAFNLLDNLE